MKFAIQAGELADALALITPKAEPRELKKFPALAAVHMAATADGVTLSTNVLDFFVVTKLAATVTECAEVGNFPTPAHSGEVAVLAAALAGIVGGLPTDAEVAISTGEQNASISCGRARYRLPTFRKTPCRLPLALDPITSETEIDGTAALRLFEPLPVPPRLKEVVFISPVFFCTAWPTIGAVCTDGRRLILVAQPAAAFSGGHEV